jgi:hypothetical protein
MKTLSLLCLLVFLPCCAANRIQQLDFLEGTWKIEGKETYEVWEKAKPQHYIGQSYKLNNGQKTISETLVIRKIDNKIVYEANVPDQNEAKTIQFVLNTENKSCYSFENIEHDFPKKIQYKKITNDKIEVSVLGDDDKGFSFTQVKLKSN